MRNALKALQREVDEVRGLLPHRQSLMNWIVHVRDMVTNGEHSVFQNAWLQDEEEDVETILDHYLVGGVEGEDVDFALIQAIGENMLEVVA